MRCTSHYPEMCHTVVRAHRVIAIHVYSLYLIDLVRQRSPLTEAAETKVLGRGFSRPIFTIENCLRNYWKLPSTFVLIDVSLNSRAR